MKEIIKAKQSQVSEIQDKINNSASVVLSDYRGLTVAEVTELRAKLRDAGVEYKVLKNTLVRRACADNGITGLEEVLVGPTSVAFSTDAVAPAKVLFEFAKEHKMLEIKGGLLEGKVVGVDGLKALALLPSREELLGQVAGAFASPMTTMASLFAAPLRDCAGVLAAVRDAKED